MKIRNWLVGVITVIALIGLGSSLIHNPLGLIKQLFVIGIVAVAIYIIYRVLVGRKPERSESRSYARAAKLSKKRKRVSQQTNSQMRKKPLRKRTASHLTVIEGKKNKKKDRAIF
ncbi:hypothetical protein KHA93_08235 [Bacillus sp. FJAT-49732]|uniref:Uncharacterized protein n=1 Tax=Lederbergia citrisecunda TaxID=2833583 RepID=A0A942TPD1_9BACI|nr:SA1362 family protein [Lederbergia citrisecunda]MBS4199642.1 hypothetical protein [Lederbergia citrisecunda]